MNIVLLVGGPKCGIRRHVSYVPHELTYGSDTYFVETFEYNYNCYLVGIWEELCLQEAWDLFLEHTYGIH